MYLVEDWGNQWRLHLLQEAVLIVVVSFLADLYNNKYW